MSEHKTKIGFVLLFVAVVSIVGFQNCGTQLVPNSGTSVTAASTGTAFVCTGTYNFNSGAGTLSIATEDSSGNITGSLVAGSVTGAITGSCTTFSSFNNITFIRTITGQTQNFSGSLSGTSGVVTSMTGTYSTCSPSCGAASNTWTATPK